MNLMISLQKKRGFFPKIQKSSVGINISDHSIKVVGISRKRGKNFIKILGAILLDRSVLKDGRIQNHQKFTNHLKEIRDKHRLNFVNVSFPAEQAKFLSLNIPPIKNKRDFLRSLHFGIEENLSLPREEFLFAHRKISTALEKGYDKVLVSVFPKKVLREYTDAFRDARLNPLYFEHEGQSLERVLDIGREKADIMIIDYGKSRTIFSFFKDGLMEECDVLKINSKSDLLDKINKKLISGKTPKAVKIIIAGDASGTKGLSEYLSNRLNLNVLRADVWKNISFNNREVPSTPLRESFGYASALGLALADSCSDF